VVLGVGSSDLGAKLREAQFVVCSVLFRTLLARRAPACQNSTARAKLMAVYRVLRGATTESGYLRHLIGELRYVAAPAFRPSIPLHQTASSPGTDMYSRSGQSVTPGCTSNFDTCLTWVSRRCELIAFQSRQRSTLVPVMVSHEFWEILRWSVPNVPLAHASTCCCDCQSALLFLKRELIAVIALKFRQFQGCLKLQKDK
jgi:hypothetical protein